MRGENAALGTAGIAGFLVLGELIPRLGLLGFALSVLFQWAERRVLAWYHGLRDATRGSS
ncbi:hypothetical protein V4Y04_33010 [Streptomyces sp. P9-A2]